MGHKRGFGWPNSRVLNLQNTCRQIADTFEKDKHPKKAVINKNCVWINQQLHQWLIISCRHWPVSCSLPWDPDRNAKINQNCDVSIAALDGQLHPAQSDVSADIQEPLTQLDRDLSDSWFGYHRGGLKGHTSAPPLSRSSFPHSERSASERLEQQRESFNHAHTDADEWQKSDFKNTDMKWHTLRHIKCVCAGGSSDSKTQSSTLKYLFPEAEADLFPFKHPSHPPEVIYGIFHQNETPLTSVCSLLCMLRATIDAWELHLHTHCWKSKSVH